MITPEIIGNKIKLARTKKKFNQQSLATLFNVSQQTVSRWENGSITPDIFTLEKIAQTLRVPLTYFFEPDSDLSKDSKPGIKRNPQIVRSPDTDVTHTSNKIEEPAGIYSERITSMEEGLGKKLDALIMLQEKNLEAQGKILERLEGLEKKEAENTELITNLVRYETGREPVKENSTNLK